MEDAIKGNTLELVIFDDAEDIKNYLVFKF